VNVRRSHVVLRSFPGEHATLVGRLGFANDASDDVVTNMTLDGRSGLPLPSVTVKGSFIRFVADDVTNENTHNCFVIGSSSGRARGIVIERSRIHHCGALPPTNQMHGIYVADADGTRIVGNVIYGNADRGIQLYPDAQGTLIERNVIDANGTGVIFSGAGGTASSGTTVQYNGISNANVRADVESWYPSGNPMGVGNVVRDNCLFGGTEGTIVSHFGGFTASANVVADPHFANAARGDFRMPRSSVCRRILERRPWR
jgi:parallel beta-helix repeat protein